MNPPLIGPLTAEEWCGFRMCEDDLLQCCGITSDFRDEVFHLLRMGGDDKHLRHGFRRAYWQMVDHGLPEGRGGELIARLVAYFLGDPPEKKTDVDGMTDAEILAALTEGPGSTSPEPGSEAAIDIGVGAAIETYWENGPVAGCPYCMDDGGKACRIHPKDGTNGEVRDGQS